MWGRHFIKTILFSNFFYGICAIALSAETAFEQKIALANPSFYLLIFCGTVLYYAYAYINFAKKSSVCLNERADWYKQNLSKISLAQKIVFVVTLACILQLSLPIWNDFRFTDISKWLIAGVLIILAYLYYGMTIPSRPKIVLRKWGFLKPLLIGFVWAGVVSAFPVIYYDTVYHTDLLFQPLTALLFLKNCLFITILCTLFDIKDYADDSNLQLKTIIVKLGLRKTLVQVILPLATGTWMIYFILAILGHFPPLSILLNSIPFILLIIVCRSMYQRKTILYYLAIIDGLMLVKAVCGIISMIILK